MDTPRVLTQVIQSIPVSDGAGVRLRRSLGQSRNIRLDPFLMLDEFSSDNPDDYIAGFPAHPHRGFETVTYMLAGHMLHEDHLGHRGHLKSGGAQWMTAGRGIIHSEMPQQEAGRLHGFQLWINLPALEKMKPAAYRDIQPEEIPQLRLPGGAEVKVIAGLLDSEGQQLAGPIQGLATAPLFLDVFLPAGARFVQPLSAEHHAFVYPYAGSVHIGPREISAGMVGVLDGGTVAIIEASTDSHFLLLAARPLNEPIVQYGPFVMNTRAEIEQALQDYSAGTLTSKEAV